MEIHEEQSRPGDFHRMCEDEWKEKVPGKPYHGVPETKPWPPGEWVWGLLEKSTRHPTILALVMTALLMGFIIIPMFRQWGHDVAARGIK